MLLHIAGPRSGHADLQPTVMAEVVLTKAYAIMRELDSLLCDSSVIREWGSGMRENKR
jgi:hypothetical protein